MSELTVTFLGTGGTVPTAKRGMPATYIQHGGTKLLFDCGEGTQRQFMINGGMDDMDAIFLTHYHTDHILGLPGLLNTLGLRGRETKLPIYGPAGLKNLFHNRFNGLIGKEIRALIDLHEIDLTIIGFRGFTIETAKAHHGSTKALSYILREPTRPGEFNPKRAIELGVEPGPDFGRLQNGYEIIAAHQIIQPGHVMGPERPGRLIGLSGDTKPNPYFAEACKGADLMIHEASFLHSDGDWELSQKKGHSTARGAAQLAKDAGARMLALHHLGTRVSAPAALNEARMVYKGYISVPADFATKVIAMRDA